MAASSTRISKRSIKIKIKDAFNTIATIELEELNEIVDALDYDDDDYHPDNVCSKLVDYIIEYISKFHYHQIALLLVTLGTLILIASPQQVCYEDGDGNYICRNIFSEEVVASII